METLREFCSDETATINGKPVQGVSMYLKAEVDKLLAEKDAEIARLRKIIDDLPSALRGEE